MSKALEELDVLSDFMMNAIANNPDVCEPFFRLMLSILLEIEIGRVTVRAQSVVPGDTPDLRGIRLDVEVVEQLETNEKTANCRIYNVEPQLYVDNLPKRSRFYQAKKDSKHLKRGERNWDMLPDLYMIIIANYDPFGEDSMVKKELLTYLNHSKMKNVTNEDIARIHDYVSSVKQSAEVEERYMTIGELMDIRAAEGERRGRIEGRIEGRSSALLDLLADLGDIPEEVRDRINCADEATLKQWTKLAAKAESMKAFLEQIK